MSNILRNRRTRDILLLTTTIIAIIVAARMGINPDVIALALLIEVSLLYLARIPKSGKQGHNNGQQ